MPWARSCRHLLCALQSEAPPEFVFLARLKADARRIAAHRAARPAAGLARTLHRTVITTYGTEMATAMTEFRREGSDRIGRQSQTWCCLDGRWQVVAAHVSLL